MPSSILICSEFVSYIWLCSIAMMSIPVATKPKILQIMMAENIEYKTLATLIGSR